MHADYCILELGLLLVAQNGKREAMAVDAIKKDAFPLSRSGNAVQPFRIAKLRGKVLRFVEPDIEFPCLVSAYRGGHAGIGSIIAGGSYGESIFARGYSFGWKCVSPLLIGIDCDRNRTAHALRANQNAFHRAFLLRRYQSSQRNSHRIHRLADACRRKKSRYEHGDA